MSCPIPVGRFSGVPHWPVLGVPRGHVKERAEVTICSVVPAGVLPELFQAAAILRCHDLGLPDELGNEIFGVMAKANSLGDPAMRFETRNLSPSDLKLDVSAIPVSLLVSDPGAVKAAETLVESDDELTTDIRAAQRMKPLLVRERYTAARVRIPVQANILPGSVPVLFAAAQVGYSGAEESFALSIIGLDPCRYYPIVVLPHRGALADRLRAAGVHVEIVQEDFAKMTLRNIRYFDALLEASGARLVHTNGNAGFPLAVAAHYRGVRWFTIRAYSTGRVRRKCWRSLRATSRFLMPSLRTFAEAT